jgi:predicted dehydrogenase
MDLNRRAFLGASAAAVFAGAWSGVRGADSPGTIQGFEQAPAEAAGSKLWRPISARKIRVGLIGYGVCQFGAAFGFQDHPNAEVVAVSDLMPERCAAMAKVCRCGKTYPSLEELIKDPGIEAVFIATDAPSHARHAIAALNAGKHVASAVPAVFGSLEEADQLLEAVRRTGLTYMMFETSYFHEDLHAMRTLYGAGQLGRLTYAEGEYFHYMPTPIDSFKGWRVGLPPQHYPTHSNAYYVGVGAGSFTEVSCQGVKSVLEHLQAANNAYKNPFGTEVAMFRTSDGAIARMGVSWDTPGAGGEMGRVRGTKGSVYNGKYEGLEGKAVGTSRPPLPPGVSPGGHGGSHGYLTDEFLSALLQSRKPLVDITQALAMTAAGIVAHQSALKDGESLKIPQYRV